MSDGWIRTEERLPTVAEPVLVARVVEIGRPMIVEQGILLPGGIWKTFGHKLKKIDTGGRCRRLRRNRKGTRYEHHDVDWKSEADDRALQKNSAECLQRMRGIRNTENG